MAKNKIEIPLTPESIPDLLEECLKASHLKGCSWSQVYPDKDVELPTIIWSVHHRIPGKEGKETLGPRPRGGKSIPLNSATLLEYMVQWNTVIYQFDLFHSSNDKVNKLVNDFEQFIIESIPSLKEINIESFRFYEQLKDYSMPDIPKELPNRSLRYEATFSVYRPVYLPRIRQILRYIRVDCLDSKEKQPHQFQATRGSGDEDTVSIPLPAITSVADVSGSPEPDYIAGVDYELVETDDGRITKITWTRAGKRPVEGATYYVTHSDLDAFSNQSIF